jgi:short-subunit dehydrogenase
VRRELAGRRILITGASSGIGRALAVAAGAAGMKVAVAARTATALEELVAGLRERGTDAVAVAADVTAADDRTRMLDVVRERWGGLDVLVNNAGVGTHGLFDHSSEPALRHIMEVNFFAPAELIRSALPLLAQGRQPAVLQVASMCGLRAMPLWTEYSASKYAIRGLIEALRGEFVRFGVDVLLVFPGMTDTNLDRNLVRTDGLLFVNFRKGMRPEQVASAMLTQLRRNRAEQVLGWEAHWMVRANRLAPRLVDWLLARVVRRRYSPEVLERAAAR